MANPQPVPFVQFSKELLDALLLSPMPASCKEIVLAVIRCTYGERGAKAAPISQSLLQLMTGRARSCVRRNMDSLLANGVLLEVSPCTARKPAVLKLNKDYERWGAWSVNQITKPEGTNKALSTDSQRAQIRPSRGHKSGPLEGTNKAPCNTVDIDTKEEETPLALAAPKKAAPENGAAKWIAAWVDALEANGDPEPTKNGKLIFGAKCKTIKEIDPSIMGDCIRTMVERSKHPGVVALVYGDCEREAKREVFEMNLGGRRVR